MSSPKPAALRPGKPIARARPLPDRGSKAGKSGKPVAKPVSKSVVKPVAKPAGKPVPSASASAQAAQLAAAIEDGIAAGNNDVVTPEALQALTGALCKAYAARVEAGEQLLPLSARTTVTPTEVMLAASGLLRAANLAVFELGMWQSWTGR